MSEIRRPNEGGIPRNPPFFRDQPREGKSDLSIALSVGDPKHLHVVRACHEPHRGFDRLRSTLAGRSEPDSFHANEVLPIRLKQREPGGVVGQDHIVKVSHDRAGNRQLGHGSVEAAMPTGVLILVTFTARFRTSISFDPALFGEQVREGRFILGREETRCRAIRRGDAATLGRGLSC